jgi:hypothetical protein
VTLDTGGSGIIPKEIALEDLLQSSSAFQNSNNPKEKFKFSLL